MHAILSILLLLADPQAATATAMDYSDAKRLAGVTGASVGAGRKLTVTADLADALIDAGYEIRVDAAVEDMRDSPSEIRVPLTSAGAGKGQAGKQYIQAFTYQLQ